MKLIQSIIIIFISISSLITPFPLKAQIWDSCGTGLRSVSAYSKEHLGKLYVRLNDSVGGMHLYNIGSWDGSVWDTVGGGIDGAFYNSVEYNNKIFISGLFKYVNGPWPGGSVPRINDFASWDGTQYQGYGIPSTSSGMRGLCVYDNEIYAGFRSVLNFNGQIYSSIFKFNDTTFNHVGGGVQGAFKEVIALTVYNGELIVGGNFNMAGTLPVNNIAKWNGTQWSNLGNGINYIVRTLLVDTINNILYAGGSFGYALNLNDTIQTPWIAKYDGNNWSAVGSLPNGPVLTMAFYKGNLYIGTSGLPGPAIWKWDGNNWSGVYPTPNKTVTCLTVYKDQLYASGAFDSIGGVPYAGFARYTDTTTVSLSPDLEPKENSFTIHPNPAKGIIALTFSKPIINRAEIIIYNIKGEAVLKEQRALLNERTEVNLPEGISSGVYVCKVIGKEVEYSRSFVVE